MTRYFGKYQTGVERDIYRVMRGSTYEMTSVWPGERRSLHSSYEDRKQKVCRKSLKEGGLHVYRLGTEVNSKKNLIYR